MVELICPLTFEIASGSVTDSACTSGSSSIFPDSSGFDFAQACPVNIASPFDSGLGTLLKAAADGRLDQVDPPRWRGGAAVAVVLAAAGYPDAPRKGDEITGVEEAEQLEGVDVIHAGTADHTGSLVTAGGRVLAVTAVGDDVAHARSRAYDGVGRIRFEGAQHRTDIAAGV